MKDDDALLELDNQLCFALHSAARQVVKAYGPLLGELGLTHPQYLVMLVLWAWAKQKHKRPSVRALGARLCLDSGTLTPVLKRMEAQGLLTRTRSEADERELQVRLTPRGAALKKRARQVPLALLQKAPISVAELLQLRDQLTRLRGALVQAASADDRGGLPRSSEPPSLLPTTAPSASWRLRAGRFVRAAAGRTE